MRKLLILSALALLATGSGCCTTQGSGGWCNCGNLFGKRAPAQQQYQYGYQPAGECCDPCGGQNMMQPTMMAVPQQAPCCAP